MVLALPHSDMTAAGKNEKPLEIIFWPGQAVGIVYLRNPHNPGPEIEHLRHALPGVDMRVDPKVDVLSAPSSLTVTLSLSPLASSKMRTAS